MSIQSEIERVFVDFKSLPEFYEKEKSGKKNNTIRGLDPEDLRLKVLELFEDGSELFIRITNTETKEYFERKITDVTWWNGFCIITWKEEFAQSECDKMLQAQREKLKIEIAEKLYWIFRDKILNGHTAIEINEGKAKAYNNKLKDTSCYICDVLHELECSVSEIFGEDNYFNSYSKLKELQNSEHQSQNIVVTGVSDDDTMETKTNANCSIDKQEKSLGASIDVANKVSELSSHSPVNTQIKKLNENGIEYKCGHKSNGMVVIDDNELSYCAYEDWSKSVGIEGTREKCWDCYCKISEVKK